MKQFKLLPAVFAIMLTFAAINSHADTSCNWDQFGFRIATGAQTLENIFYCTKNGTPIATKTVTVTSKGAPQCSLSVHNNDVTNKGSCVSPNIAPITCTPTTVTQTISIGVSCSTNANWSCGEAFGRACASQGGTTVVEYTEYKCKKTVTQCI